ncbi:uncharacterized protein PAC_17986 [Phialocephala subalpina]|uniref:Uncharacterized protein n=1 Tax=Phialocephala subalpina TaxID=576137 RepID=A0A1L7XSY5_9HELO|nr:uncharacterized protein PAC_17986 [Phialocephala subalpina]
MSSTNGTRATTGIRTQTSCATRMRSLLAVASPLRSLDPFKLERKSQYLDSLPLTSTQNKQAREKRSLITCTKSEVHSSSDDLIEQTKATTALPRTLRFRSSSNTLCGAHPTKQLAPRETKTAAAPRKNIEVPINAYRERHQGPQEIQAHVDTERREASMGKLDIEKTGTTCTP